MARGVLRLLGLALLCGGLLGACAGNLPKGLRQDPADAPSAREVQADPDRFVGREVRWGGEILGLRNLRGSTEVEFYTRPLMSSGEPRPDGGDRVRVIARIEGFVDPAEYRPGKRLTVRGRLADAVTRLVGDYPYRYPVVAAGLYHLWPAYLRPPDAIWPGDPFYDPWWPWRPWPYRRWPYGW